MIRALGMHQITIILLLQVSWVRRRDWHILTVGDKVFTQDARFGLHHKPKRREWTLVIKYLQNRDEGTYVCQVFRLF